MAIAAPAFISHTVLVHAGSYKDFTLKLTTQYPKLAIKFIKKVAIHYYVIQLEDHNDVAIKKQQIYDLPIMAMREEFSGFLFFKNTKSYNNVLKRMCGAPDNEMAAYDLIQHMLTPFEKGVLLNLADAKSIEFTSKEPGSNVDMITSIHGKDRVNSIQTLGKIFGVQKCRVDDIEIDLSLEVKDMMKKWIVGIK